MSCLVIQPAGRTGRVIVRKQRSCKLQTAGAATNSHTRTAPPFYAHCPPFLQELVLWRTVVEHKEHGIGMDTKTVLSYMRKKAKLMAAALPADHPLQSRLENAKFTDKWLRSAARRQGKSIEDLAASGDPLLQLEGATANARVRPTRDSLLPILTLS